MLLNSAYCRIGEVMQGSLPEVVGLEAGQNGHPKVKMNGSGCFARVDAAKSAVTGEVRNPGVLPRLVAAGIPEEGILINVHRT